MWVRHSFDNPFWFPLKSNQTKIPSKRETQQKVLTMAHMSPVSFHLLKNMFYSPLLVSKGIYHFVEYLYFTFPRGLNQMDGNCRVPTDSLDLQGLPGSGHCSQRRAGMPKDPFWLWSSLVVVAGGGGGCWWCCCGGCCFPLCVCVFFWLQPLALENPNSVCLLGFLICVGKPETIVKPS